MGSPRASSSDEFFTDEFFKKDEFFTDEFFTPSEFFRRVLQKDEFFKKDEFFTPETSSSDEFFETTRTPLPCSREGSGGPPSQKHKAP